MPTTTPRIKVDAVRALGGEVVLSGDSYSDANSHALVLEKKDKLTFVHPYDDPEVIAGQGTGGGLISGVATYVKALSPRTRIIGVEAVDADAMDRSLKAGKRVRLAQVGLFADGAAVKEVGVETFRLCQQHVDAMVLVDNDARPRVSGRADPGADHL